MEEVLNQLAPVFLVRGFMNPAAEGAIAVDLDCGYVLELEAEVFDHEVFSLFVGALHGVYGCSMQ